MLAFKRSGTDVHHVGIVTGEGTVIHSSSAQGGMGVVETLLARAEGWTHLAVHRYIETSEGGEKPQEGAMESYKAIVTLRDPSSSLNVRNAPKTGDVMGRLLDGQVVTVQAEADGWAFISYGDSELNGYVSAEYLAPYTEPEEQEPLETTTLINELTGDTFMLVGKWTTAED